MAFEHGTAQNLADFIDKLQSFLTSHPDLLASGQAWQRLHDITVPTSGTTFESRGIAFKAPGLGGADEIYIGMNTWGNTAADWYNLRLYGGTSFDANLITETNGSVISGFLNPSPPTQLLLWNAPMPYWFFANGRRVWLVGKVSSQYESGGAGFILPPCAPSHYPYPLMISGGYAGHHAVRWSDHSERHRGISSPYYYNCFIRTADGVWTDFCSHNYDSSSYRPDIHYRALWPLGANRYRTDGYNSVSRLRDSFGTFPLLPLTFCTFGSQGRAQWGEMDGAYYLPAQNSGAEDVITHAGIDYIVFQTAHRSGNPWLFALRAD